jgi:hypothetical protein
VSLIRIEQLRPALTEAYDQFLVSRRETLFYCSTRYKDFLKQLLSCDEHYLLAMRGDEIIGALPLLFKEYDGRRVYNSLPYYGSNGGFVTGDAQAARELADAYKEISLATTTISATIIDNPFAETVTCAVPENFSDQRIGQFTSIAFTNNQREEILARIDSSARRNVMKAARTGIVVETDASELPRLRELHQANMAAIGGLPKTDAFFDLIPQHFEPGKDFDVYVARKDGLVIAGLLLFYFNQIVEYIMPAIDAEHRSLQPLSLILIQAMSDAARRGFTWWNWGGTWNTQQGVYRFKKKWGAAERRYDYHIQLNDLSLLEWPKENILKAFPGFYIAPFSALQVKE